MITVIGIGTAKGDLTDMAAKLIAKSKCVYLRSAMTAAGKGVTAKYEGVRTLDECFASAKNFEEWSERASEILLEAEREYGDVAYLTDGDGFGDTCALKLSRKTQVVFEGGKAAHATRKPCGATLSMSAYTAIENKPYLDTSVGIHITEIDDAYAAGEIKLWLMEYYGDETSVNVSVKGKTSEMPLAEIDRLHGYGYDCELFIAPIEGLVKERYSFGDLQRIMHRLTAPDGCPWDKVQTHESVRVNMIEEAYEAVDAVNADDLDAQIEEFGDVMLQAVLNCDIARRSGEYDMPDVISELCRKLVTRHTHIFGAKTASDADEALTNWEAAKAEEKQYVSAADKINRLPECFPSLLAASKVYKKLLKAGVRRCDDALKSPLECMKNLSEQECARKLFFIAAALGELGIDGETALSSYIARIKRDFTEAEKSGKIADFFDKLCE